MKKGSVYTTIGVVGATLGVMAIQSYLKNNKIKDEHHSFIDRVGVPDQTKGFNDTQLENSKMVSEGSTYGVHYYNEYKNE